VLLDVKNLSVSYGSVEALHSATFSVDANEIVAMIGPNGAGKSSALKAISGVLDYYRGRIVSGAITYIGADITGAPASTLAKMGIAVVPEGRRVFPSMTVRENLEMGGYSRTDRSEIDQSIESIYLVFPILKERRRQTAGTLSGGEQQMLALGRALMLKPKLLLADEPSLGLSPNYVDLIFNKFIEINRQGIAVLLVEQNAGMALEIAHRGIVFDIGQIALQNSTAILRTNPLVQRVYLGG
jgi:branched-chain amino acid transport system ATP-binding protein